MKDVGNGRHFFYTYRYQRVAKQTGRLSKMFIVLNKDDTRCFLKLVCILKR